MREPLEGPGDLPDAAGWILRETAVYRIVIDDGAQDEGVVGVQPERQLLVLRQLVHSDCRQSIHESFQPPAFRFQRAVVDESVANVQVEDGVERLSPRRIHRLLRVGCRDKQQREYDGCKTHNLMQSCNSEFRMPNSEFYSRCSRNRASAALNAAGCSRFAR